MLPIDDLDLSTHPFNALTRAGSGPVTRRALLAATHWQLTATVQSS